MRLILLALCCFVLFVFLVKSLIGFNGNNELTFYDLPQAVLFEETLLALVKKEHVNEYGNTLTLACKEVKFDIGAKRSQTSILSQDESFALQSALIAKVLIERLRNNVNFSGKVKQDFFQIYHSKCSKFLSEIPQIKFFEFQAVSERMLNDHANILLQYALSKFQINPTSVYQSYVYSVQWLYHNLNDNHQAAKDSARLAILKHGKEGYIVDLAEKYSYLGTSLLQLGQFKEALFYMRKGLVTTLKKQNDQQYADAHFRLGFAYLKAGDYDSAKRYFELFLRMEFGQDKSFKFNALKCHDYSIRAAKGLVNLGKIDRINGNFKEAIEKHTCGISRLEGEPDYYYYVAVLEKSKDLAAMGNHRQARVLATHLANNKRIFDSHQLQALLVVYAADLKQQPPLVDLNLEKRISALIGLNDGQIKFPREFIEYSHLRMNHAAAIGDEQGFIENAKAGFTTIQQYRQTGLLSDAWMTTQYQFVESYVKAIYTNSVYSHREKLEAIVNVLDKYYALNDFDARKSHIDFVGEQQGSAELKLLKDKQKQAEIHLINSARQNRVQLQAKLDNANEALMAYKVLEHDGEFNEELTLDDGYSIEQIQYVLKEGEMLLRYFVTKEQSLVIAITKQQLLVHHLPKLDIIRNEVAKLKTWVNRKQLTKLMKSEVFRQLLPLDYIAEYSIDKLIIIPDDVLHQVPFGGIETAKENSKYQGIGKQTKIVRTHSIQDYFLTKLDERQLAQAANQISIFADPALNENTNYSASVLEQFERLPFTAEEAQNIKASYSDIQINLYQGEQVTNENLLSFQARQSKVLHIATHGFYNPAIPDVVGIITYDQEQAGVLSLTELLSNKFDSHLVVISGCETMLGKYYKGSGMKSFTRGFLSKGAGSVLGSLWKVPDRSTALFMSYFYAQLRKNNGNSVEALKIARQKFTEHSEFYDPFYWAGFVLTSVNQQYNQIHFD